MRSHSRPACHGVNGDPSLRVSPRRNFPRLPIAVLSATHVARPRSPRSPMGFQRRRSSWGSSCESAERISGSSTISCSSRVRWCCLFRVAACLHPLQPRSQVSDRPLRSGKRRSARRTKRQPSWQRTNGAPAAGVLDTVGRQSTRRPKVRNRNRIRAAAIRRGTGLRPGPGSPTGPSRARRSG